jgi:hypothetical protein
VWSAVGEKVVVVARALTVVAEIYEGNLVAFRHVRGEDGMASNVVIGAAGIRIRNDDNKAITVREHSSKQFHFYVSAPSLIFVVVAVAVSLFAACPASSSEVRGLALKEMRPISCSRAGEDLSMKASVSDFIMARVITPFVARSTALYRHCCSCPSMGVTK